MEGGRDASSGRASLLLGGGAPGAARADGGAGDGTAGGGDGEEGRAMGGQLGRRVMMLGRAIIGGEDGCCRGMEEMNGRCHDDVEMRVDVQGGLFTKP